METSWWLTGDNFQGTHLVSTSSERAHTVNGQVSDWLDMVGGVTLAKALDKAHNVVS